MLFMSWIMQVSKTKCQFDTLACLSSVSDFTAVYKCVWKLILFEYKLIIVYVQTSSEAHPASYPVGTGVLSPGVKCTRGVTLTIHPHLVPMS
jgi:hypothetical protein